MIDCLKRALLRLPSLLDEASGWDSLDIDHDTPRVERLYRPHERGRLYLHRIAPCELDAALFHPHPWPCAIRVLRGRYETTTGFGPGDRVPPVASRLLLEAPFSYEMTHPDAWHAVAPRGGSALTVMVTGEPWDRWSPRSSAPLRALSRDAREELLSAFREALAEDGPSVGLSPARG